MHIDEYDVYGTTIKRKLYETDSKERYFHLFHSIAKEGEERSLLAKKLRRMKAHLMQHTNEVIEFGPGFQHYYQAVDALQKILDKRDAQRKEDLWNAIIKSEKSYDEILTFITAGQTTEED